MALTVKNPLQCRRPRLDPWVGKIPWRRKWQPTLIFLPGESHGGNSVVGYSPQNSLGQNIGVASSPFSKGCSLFQGIFSTQGSNPGLQHCRQILYQLSHQATPRILEWVAYPFSNGLPDEESNRGLLHSGGFFTS